MRFTPEQREALTAMLTASQRVSEVFSEFSPWGLASKRITRSLGRTLRAERSQLQRPLSEDQDRAA